MVVVGHAGGGRIGLVDEPAIGQSHPISGPTAEAISQGDLSRRAEVQSEDEMGVLARVFNDMADRIEEDIRVLEKAVVEQDSATRELGQANFELAEIISERELAEEALRRSEEQQRALVNAIPDAMIRIYLDGTILACKTARNWELPVLCGEIQGQHIGAILPTDIADLFLLHSGTAHESAETQLFEYQMTVNGVTSHYEVRLIASGDAESTGIVRDITEAKAEIEERRRAEEELRHSEQRIRSVLDTVADAIIVMDDQSQIVAFNPAAQRIFGYPHDEIIGQNVAILIPEPYRGHLQQYLQDHLSAGDNKMVGIGAEPVGLRKDGSTFPMDLDIGEFWLGGKRMFTGIARDITERKEIERKK